VYASEVSDRPLAHVARSTGYLAGRVRSMIRWDDVVAPPEEVVNELRCALMWIARAEPISMAWASCPRTQRAFGVSDAAGPEDPDNLCAAVLLFSGDRVHMSAHKWIWEDGTIPSDLPTKMARFLAFSAVAVLHTKSGEKGFFRQPHEKCDFSARIKTGSRIRP